MLIAWCFLFYRAQAEIDIHFCFVMLIKEKVKAQVSTTRMKGQRERVNEAKKWNKAKCNCGEQIPQVLINKTG